MSISRSVTQGSIKPDARDNIAKGTFTLLKRGQTSNSRYELPTSQIADMELFQQQFIKKSEPSPVPVQRPPVDFGYQDEISIERVKSKEVLGKLGAWLQSDTDLESKKDKIAPKMNGKGPPEQKKSYTALPRTQKRDIVLVDASATSGRVKDLSRPITANKNPNLPIDDDDGPRPDPNSDKNAKKRFNLDEFEENTVGRFQNWENSKQKKIATLRRGLAEDYGKQHPHMPKINDESRLMNKNQQPLTERVQTILDEKAQKQSLIKKDLDEQRAKRELGQCTFTPKINKTISFPKGQYAKRESSEDTQPSSKSHRNVDDLLNWGKTRETKIAAKKLIEYSGNEVYTFKPEILDKSKRMLRENVTHSSSIGVHTRLYDAASKKKEGGPVGDIYSFKPNINQNSVKMVAKKKREERETIIAKNLQTVLTPTDLDQPKHIPNYGDLFDQKFTEVFQQAMQRTESKKLVGSKSRDAFVDPTLDNEEIQRTPSREVQSGSKSQGRRSNERYSSGRRDPEPRAGFQEKSFEDLRGGGLKLKDMAGVAGVKVNSKRTLGTLGSGVKTPRGTNIDKNLLGVKGGEDG
jgi:hypothetical protein